MSADRPDDPRGSHHAGVVSALRRLRVQRPSTPVSTTSRCELCRITLPDEHKHLLHLDERRILCVCSACWSIRSGDAEFRPAGNRVQWLAGFDFPDDLWAAFDIPVNLAFFLKNGASGQVVALYPSPAGATESELDLAGWQRLVTLNPVLNQLEPDAEALIVHRRVVPPQYAIVPVDECYRLVGVIKSTWQGFSGGDAVETATARFFDEMRARALVP